MSLHIAAMTGEQKSNLTWPVLRANRPGSQPSVPAPPPTGMLAPAPSHQAALPKGAPELCSKPLKRQLGGTAEKKRHLISVLPSHSLCFKNKRLPFGVLTIALFLLLKCTFKT